MKSFQKIEAKNQKKLERKDALVLIYDSLISSSR